MRVVQYTQSDVEASNFEVDSTYRKLCDEVRNLDSVLYLPQVEGVIAVIFRK